MSQIRQDEFDSVLEALEDGVQTVHISGQPGVGKSTFFEDLADELSTSYRTRVHYVREGNSPTTLTQELLYEIRDAVGSLRSLLNRATGMSIGVGTPLGSVSAGGSTDDRARHLQKLADISESVKSRNPLVLFVDDVHKLAEPDHTRGYLRELSTNLGENVHLITAGRLTYQDSDLNVHLESFTREETAAYVRETYSDVESETVDRLYEQLDGHPYYLSLLTEAADADTTFRLPEEDTRDFIERDYLDSMLEDEEEFIRQTAGLVELDEDICSAVLDDLNRTQVRRILDALSSKVVVSELGRSKDTGDRIFKVHDLFREFLHQQLENPTELHRAAFQYYAKKLYEEIEDSQVPQLAGFVSSVMANVHLNVIYSEEPSVDEVRSEVDQLDFDPAQRLQFIYGYAPYSPSIDEHTPKLLALELDDYVGWLRNQESNDETEEFQIEVYSVLFDLMRVHYRGTTDTEFETPGSEVYESTMQRIDEVDFVGFFDEDEREVAQIIPDIFQLCAHVVAYRGLEDKDDDVDHLSEAYDTLEKYGLNRVAIEGFLTNCRQLADEHDAGQQAEEMIEAQIENFFEEFSQSEATRNTLLRMQTDLFDEIIEMIQSAISATISESDRLLEFIHDCGDSLNEAENPLFVAIWYSFAAEIYQAFAPETAQTKELEEAARRTAEQRIEYEDDLETPIYEIEEFSTDNVDLPKLVDDVVDGNQNNQLIK